MLIRRLDYDDNGAPERATFEVTLREMAYLTKLLGQQTGNMQEETMPGGMGIDCYSALSDVFTRHWDDGVDDYLRGADR